MQHLIADAAIRYRASDLDSLSPLATELLWTAGRGRSGDPVFYDITGLSVDDDGNVYVLQPRSGVIVLDSTGALAHQFGPYGRGPGELWNPRGIAVGRDTVYVLDDAIEFFDLSGTYRGQAVTTGAQLTAHDISYTRLGLATHRWRMQRPRGEDHSTDTLEVRLHDLSNARESLPIRRIPYSMYRLSANGLEGAPVLGVQPGVAITSSGTVISSHPELFILVETGPAGDTIRTASADLARVPTTRDDFRDAKASVTNGAGYPADIAASLSQAYEHAARAEFRPAIGRLIGSPEGALLIHRPDLDQRPYDRTSESRVTTWMVMDSAWRPVGSLMLPTRFVPTHFRGCLITGRQRDSLDVPFIARYRVSSFDLPCRKLPETQ